MAEEISGNHFRIAGGKPGGKVSWQVTGIRQDAYANAHRIPVEVEKPSRERGYYLHPELFGAPREKGVVWARHPELMKRAAEGRTGRVGLGENKLGQPKSSLTSHPRTMRHGISLVSE